MKVLIIEDERLAADKLIDLLQHANTKINIVGQCRSVELSVSWLRNNEIPELIFSDIELLDGKCFEIFEQVDISCPVIFTTAYDQYAIKAFETNGLSYLLKPVTEESLNKALQKVRLFEKSSKNTSGLEEIKNLLEKKESNYKNRFLVKVGQKIRSIPVRDIAYFLTQDKLTYLISRENQKYPLDQPLDELEDLLDPHEFFRINRKYLASIDSINEIHPYFKGRVKITLNPYVEDDIVVSSDKTPPFKAWLDQ